MDPQDCPPSDSGYFHARSTGPCPRYGDARPVPFDPVQGVLLALLFTLIGAAVLLCLTPPVCRDGLVHHLAIPKIYLEHRKMVELPHLEFSYYPMNLDLLYLIPLAFGTDIVPKMIHLAFGLLTAASLYRYLLRRTHRALALYGALFFLSIPLILKLSTTVYVDLGVIFFASASLILLLRWRETGYGLRLLVLSGVSCGLALGTKYSALLILPLLTLAVPFLLTRAKLRPGALLKKASANSIIFFLAALLAFLPWMIRNVYWKGNPIHPLYQTLFAKASTGEKGADLLPRSSADPYTYRRIAFGETPWEIALLPLRVFFEGKDDDQRYFDGRLNPFLLFLPLCGFLGIRRDPEPLRTEKLLFASFSLLLLLMAILGNVVRIRYFSAILPCLVILSCLGAHTLFTRAQKARKGSTRTALSWLLFFVLAIPLTLNAIYLVEQFRIYRPFAYLSGEIPKRDYLSHFLPEYPAMEYINGTLAREAVIAMVFIGKRGYYLDRRYFVEEQNAIHRALLRSRDPKEIVDAFKIKGVTHLLVHMPLLTYWAGEVLTPEQRQVLGGFLETEVDLLFEKNGVAVFGLTMVN